MIKKRKNTNHRHRWSIIKETTQVCMWCYCKRIKKQSGHFNYFGPDGEFLFVGRKFNPPKCIDKSHL